MKKSLLLATALVAALSATAASDFEKADPSMLKTGPQATAAKGMPKAQTRADGAMETFEFSYAEQPYSGLYLNGVTPGTSRVYMCFQMSQEDIKAMAGSKVKSFTTYSPTDYSGRTNTITEARFFYSTDPSLATIDYQQDFTVSKTPYAANSADLDEPYTITGNEQTLFFGYSLVVPQADNMYYMIIDGMPNDAATLIFGISDDGNSIPEQFYVGGDYYGALCMSVLLERESFPKTISFAEVPEGICLPLGKNVSLPISIKASSSVPIKSFDIEYSLAGVPYVSSYVYENPIPAGVNRYMGALLEFEAQNTELREDVAFRLTKLNGEAYAGEGDTANATIVVTADAPVHQTLIEEYTSTACMYCPRGFAALEYIRKNYPEFIAVSYHTELNGSTDPMQVTENFPSPDLSASLPSAILNRQVAVDPHDGTSQYNDLLVPVIGDVEDQNAIPTPWKVDVSHIWTSDSLLTVKAEVSNMCGYEKGDYRMAYILVADGLTGKASSWVQQNAYYQTKPQFCDELNDFCLGGKYGKSRVAGLVFNDVVISEVGINGVAGSIPTSLDPAQEAEHSVTFDLSKIKSYLIPDKNKLRVVAAVLDARGYVLNCAKDEVNDFIPSGVAGVEDENAPVEYYNLNGMKVANPTEGVFIRRQGAKAEKVLVR